MSTNDSIKIFPDVGDIFWYELYHVYAGGKGILRIGISLLFFFFGIYSIGKVIGILTILMLIFGTMNIVITPLMLYMKASTIHKNQMPAQYTFRHENVKVVQGEKEVTICWSNFHYIAMTKRCIILYTDSEHALLIPCRQLDEPQRREIKKYIYV